MYNLLKSSILLFFLFFFYNNNNNLHAQAPIQHELGLQAGGGVSIFTFFGRDMGPSASAQLKYNLLLLNGRLLLGAGLGYQYKSFNYAFEYTDDQGNLTGERGHTGYHRGIGVLPISIGYRSPGLGQQQKHHWFANALVIPTYLLYHFSRSELPDWGVQYTYYNQNDPFYEPPTVGLDLGVQVGYQLDFSPRWSWQIAMTTTYEVVPNYTTPARFYVLGVETGLYYTL